MASHSRSACRNWIVDDQTIANEIPMCTNSMTVIAWMRFSTECARATTRPSLEKRSPEICFFMNNTVPRPTHWPQFLLFRFVQRVMQRPNRNVWQQKRATGYYVTIATPYKGVHMCSEKSNKSLFVGRTGKTYCPVKCSNKCSISSSRKPWRNEDMRFRWKRIWWIVYVSSPMVA